MFNIVLFPVPSPINDTPPTVNGDVITYRGESYDFSPLPEGGIIELDEPFRGNVARKDGVIHLTLSYQYSWFDSEQDQSTNWDDYTFNVNSGACPCPIKRKPEPETFNMSEVFEA